MQLILLSQDLMSGARLEGAARKAGLVLRTAGNPAAAIEAASAPEARLLLIDLQVAGLDIAAVVAAARKGASEHNNPLAILAYGPHVHEDRLAAARAAGCDAVVSRGQLDRQADSLLAALLGG
jgi:CheY-like chemotaxis protein